MKYITTVNDQEFEVEIIDERHVRLNGEVYEINFESIHDQPVYSLLIDGQSYEAYISLDEGEWQVLLRGDLYGSTVEDEREKRLRAASGAAVGPSGEFQLKAPMPGLVVSIPVEEGQEVKKGDVLLILESMKMQNELKSSKDGTVQQIRVIPGASVEQKQVLIVIL